MRANLPEKQGLYDPGYEKDACGVGFIVNVKGEKSHELVKNGLMILKRMTHRGAVGSDPKTGDGAGILIQIPHEFYAKAAAECGINLPELGMYGTGIIFMPSASRNGEESVKSIKSIIDKHVKESGNETLGFREIKVNDSILGPTALKSKPDFIQVFIKKANTSMAAEDFERDLYIIRKKTENAVRSSAIKGKEEFYVTNISSRVVIYKGLMLPESVADFYPDLTSPLLKSSIALVHSRYSTNTFPTWDLAQPFRYLAHNGEINTLRGNINWMKGREGLFKGGKFGDQIEHVKPVIRDERQSDSASLDNAFELLVQGGRSMAHSMMMLVPEAWEHNDSLTNSLRSFYKYHACFMEPWDGPAALAFTDGIRVGAVLDRNGLRPSRYIITNDGYVVLASEAGVLEIDMQNIRESGRLEPGKIFFIDTEKQSIITDNELKTELARMAPYRQWRKEQLVYLEDLDEAPPAETPEEAVLGVQKAFGYTREDIKDIIKPMAADGKEPVGSMGNDLPHSVLSERPKLLYTYFKQLFAQVTNPPIDSEREDIVMSLRSFIGPRQNLFEENELHAHKVQVLEPILTNEELAKIRKISVNGFKTKTITLLYMPGSERNFKDALDRVCAEAVKAVKEGYSFIILSDRGVTEEYAALPALLAIGAVHQELVKKGLRTHATVILESAEPREVHHFCVLFGFGAGVINPYMAYDTIKQLIKDKELKGTYEEHIYNYRKAVNKGMLKIMAKMGISTLQSYRGSQIFEALGISNEVIDRCFAGCISRIGGVGFKEIAAETELAHKKAFGTPKSPVLETGGIYQWKKDGELHGWNPEVIAAMQDAAKNNDRKTYNEFAKLVDERGDKPVTLRSLLKFKQTGKSVPLGEVEPVESIVSRFVTGAMSYGSISRGAHEAMAIAMNRLKGKSNTGEGGEDPARFKPYPNGDSARSAVKQVASGRFGVNTNYLVNADEIQIKIAQGAKPGEGGQLPGHKVSEIIAKTRYTTPGVTLISPPPHNDIYSIEDLKQLIFDLKNVNPMARISVKLVSEAGVGTIAAGVAKGFADMILISGFDGGTGASPRGSIMHAGLPWELGLSETHQTLVMNDLRSRVRLQTDGQLRTGRDIVIAAMLGAEEYGFATGALIILGCVMVRHCHLNNCSVGVATQDEFLQKRFRGSADYLVNYFRFVAEHTREIMASLGFRKIEEMIGRTDMLELNEAALPWIAKNIDLSRILYRPEADGAGLYYSTPQQHEIKDVLDLTLIEKSKPALETQAQVMFESNINNSNRSVGAMLSGEVCRRYGEQALKDDTIHVKFKGYAGQSFGAWLAEGVTFEMEGICNDYVGKGISGGKLIVYPSKKAAYKADENIIIGNTTFYGAISGEAYIRGRAGERFCIRNSGLYGVVEGTGDHGC